MPEFCEVCVFFTATYLFSPLFSENISMVVVLVKTGIHIPSMEMTTSFETRLHKIIWLHNTYTRRLPLWQVL